MRADRRTFLRASGAGAAALLAARAEALAALTGVPRLADAPSPARLADEYLLAPGLLYLNHGAIGTIPRVVHDAHVAYLRACETDPNLHLWGGAWNDELAATRATVADFVGADAAEVAFTHNTTEGFNILAQGLPLGPGDEVVFSTLNHASASQAWRHYGERRGYTVRTFDIPLERIPSLTVDEVVALHEAAIGPATRVLVFPEVDNMVGLRHPVAELTAMARRRGVEFVAVDGAQVLGMLPVDFHGGGADFYAASPHKWLQAPKGLGLLLARRGVQAALAPLWVKTPRRNLPETAEVFEDYSTRNLPAVLALADAVAFQRRLGPAEKTARHMATRAAFHDAVAAAPGLGWRSPTDPALAAALFAVETPGRRSGEVAARLAEAGVVVRAFGGGLNTLRVSPNLELPPDGLARFLAGARGA